MVSDFRKQIVETVRLDNVVSRYTTVYRASKSGKTKCCNCLFHPDEKSSFKLRTYEHIYECTVCKETGDIVDLVQIMEGCNEYEALLLLAEWYDIKPENPKHSLSTLTDKINKRHEKEDKLIRVYDGCFLDTIASSLSTEECEEPLFSSAYASLEVGLSPDILPDTYRDLADNILFPVRDRENVLQGFVKHRTFAEDERFESYPDDLVDCFLLGLNQAVEAIKKRGFVYLVWSTRELLAMYEAGFTNTVACCNGELTFRHVKELARHTQQVVFIFKDKLNKQIQLTKASNRLNHYGIHCLYFPIHGKLPNMICNVGKDKFEYFIRRTTRMILLNNSREELIKVLDLKAKELEKERALVEKVRIRTEMIELRKKLDRMTAILSK